MKLDRKTRRLMTRIEEHAEALANISGDLVRYLSAKGIKSPEILIDGICTGTGIASACRVVLNKPASSDEERQARALIAREKRAAKRAA